MAVASAISSPMLNFEVVAERSLNSALGNDARPPLCLFRSSTLVSNSISHCICPPHASFMLSMYHPSTYNHPEGFLIAGCLVLGWMPWQCSG